ncbi:hypothetical protein C6P82_15850 [Burkholderia multivorans]|nr:hypothetical protein C6P82_15850 [Burkholderia multivorans]
MEDVEDVGGRAWSMSRLKSVGIGSGASPARRESVSYRYDILLRLRRAVTRLNIARFGRHTGQASVGRSRS